MAQGMERSSMLIPPLSFSNTSSCTDGRIYEQRYRRKRLMQPIEPEKTLALRERSRCGAAASRLLGRNSRSEGQAVIKAFLKKLVTSRCLSHHMMRSENVSKLALILFRCSACSTLITKELFAMNELRQSREGKATAVLHFLTKGLC